MKVMQLQVVIPMNMTLNIMHPVSTEIKVKTITYEMS